MSPLRECTSDVLRLKFKSQLHFPPLFKFSVTVIIQNNATDSEKRISRTLTRDENFNFRAAYWSDLHGLLYDALPPGIVYWGHLFLSFNIISGDKPSVKVKAKVIQTDEIVEVVGDLLIAADGCLSSIRRHFLPDLKLRFALLHNKKIFVNSEFFFI